MRITVEVDGKRYALDRSRGVPIAIELQFNGPQPSHFGAEPARQSAYQLGTFSGRTTAGAGCNVDRIQLVPHCNGTHTETVWHITDQPLAIAGAAVESFFSAAVLSVAVEDGSETGEHYRPALERGDLTITQRRLLAAWRPLAIERIEALIVRTLPNLPDKRYRQYGPDCPSAFFTIEAIDFVNRLGVRHLLVDLPSIDRMHDQGWLTNHHRFWNIPELTSTLTSAAWTDKTITEMVFVPDEVVDGEYLLTLQIPRFCADAAPSRPILFPITEGDHGRDN